MAVNERLLHPGLFDQFYNAVAHGDKAHLRAILFKCFLDQDDVEAILNKELKK